MVQRAFGRHRNELGSSADLGRSEVLEPFSFAVIDVRPLIVAHENVATFADMSRVDHGVAELPALALGELSTFADSRKAAVADDDKGSFEEDTVIIVTQNVVPSCRGVVGRKQGLADYERRRLWTSPERPPRRLTPDRRLNDLAPGEADLESALSLSDADERELMRRPFEPIRQLIDLNCVDEVRVECD